MATFKIVWRRGTIYVRIHHKKTKFKKIYKCLESEWDDKNRCVNKKNPNYKKINLLISNTLKELQDKELDFENEGVEFTVDELVNKKTQITVLDCFDTYLSYLEDADKLDQKRKSENVKNHISKYKDITVKSLNLMWLKNLELYLLKEGISKNTIHKYFGILKTTLKFNGFVPTAFNQIKLTKTPPSQPTITRNQFKQLEEYSGDFQIQLDAHLLQYYTWGTRISNILLLKEENLTDTTLEFYEVKDNPRKKIVPLTPKIMSIIEKYRGQGEFLIPLHRSGRKVDSAVSTINLKLKLIAAKLGIDVNLRTHVARYSFITWLEEDGVSRKNQKDMVNHATESMTEHYSQAEKNIELLAGFASSIFDTE